TTPRSRGPGSGGCTSSPPSTACASSRWGRRRTTASRPRRARRTSASGASCSADPSVTIVTMSLGDLWSRTLVYFGIAEEDEDYYADEETYAAEESLEQSYRERPNVRRLTPRRRGQDFDDWTESSEAERYPRRQAPRAVPLQAVQDPNAVRVHLVLPRSFNDA